MGADKLEKYIKKTLKEREITPSKTSWDRVASELDQPKLKRKIAGYWYGIAASIIGLLLVSLWYLQTKTPDLKNGNQIVETEVKKEIERQDIEIVAPVGKDRKESVVALKEEKQSFHKKEVFTSTALENTVLTENTVVMDQGELNSKEKKVKAVELILEEKVSEMMGLVQQLENTNDITDAEIDSLLNRAQNEILTDKIFATNKSVDAMALLSEIENDLDQSFRAKIFDTLKDKFLKARTAVADRNN